MSRCGSWKTWFAIARRKNRRRSVGSTLHRDASSPYETFSSSPRCWATRKRYTNCRLLKMLTLLNELESYQLEVIYCGARCTAGLNNLIKYGRGPSSSAWRLSRASKASSRTPESCGESRTSSGESMSNDAWAIAFSCMYSSIWDTHDCTVVANFERFPGVDIAPKM